MRRCDRYHEDSNWWEDESKDESTDTVAVALSHPGSAAQSFSEIIPLISALKSQSKGCHRYIVARYIYKMINTGSGHRFSISLGG